MLIYKQTKLWIVDKNNENLKYTSEIKEAALWIKRGDVVAFPTETVYGLGANAFNETAVSQIFAAKGRPSDNPLIVHVASISQVKQLVTNIPDVAQKLMDAFWPGPLTLILESNQKISNLVTAGLATIAIRIPDHPVALALLEAADVPVAAPSANRSGKPSPTQAIHVLHDLTGRIDGVIDGGPTGVGVESTVVDCTTEIPTILRPGGITKEELEGVIGNVYQDEALTDKSVVPKSPGQKYTHYAPNAPLIIVVDDEERVERIEQSKAEGFRVGVLATEENVDQYKKADVVINVGSRNQLRLVAQKLYDTLRMFDAKQVDIIYAESFPKEGIGEAIMNRLEKSAKQIISR